MRGSLTHGGPLLAVSARTVGVEDPDDFIKAAVELRAIRRETQRMSRCQLIQVIVGSKRCTKVPVESIPYVDRVVSAAAGNAKGETRRKIKKLNAPNVTAKTKTSFLQTKSIVLGKTRDCDIRLDSQSGFHSNGSTKDPFTIENLTNEELQQFEMKYDKNC